MQSNEGFYVRCGSSRQMEHSTSMRTRPSPNELHHDEGHLLAPVLVPLLAPIDMPAVAEATTTIVEGHSIVGFVIGGEMRLCLPQILNTILGSFGLPEINAACDELQIFCSRCGPAQLETLKRDGVLPASAHSCGLITRTDAERLCAVLLHRYGERGSRYDLNEEMKEHDLQESSNVSGERRSSMSCPSRWSQERKERRRDIIRVLHKCFGRCEGVFLLATYTAQDARAIICRDCSGMFTPAQFVCHSHGSAETRTVHWGFESSNWRQYLRPVEAAEEEENERRWKMTMWEVVKARFDQTLSESLKRRLEEDVLSIQKDVSSVKRVKHNPIDHLVEVEVSNHATGPSHPVKVKDISSRAVGDTRYFVGDQRDTSTSSVRHEKPFAPNVSITNRESSSRWSDEGEGGDVEKERGREGRQVVPKEVNQGQGICPRRQKKVDEDLQVYVPPPPTSLSPLLTAEAKLASVLETELNIFKTAIGHRGPSELNEKYLREFVRQQQIELTLIGDLVHGNRMQQQELRYLYTLMKTKTAEAAVEQQRREQQLAELRASNEAKLSEAEREIERLRKEREAIVNGNKRSDVGLVKAKYKAQAEHRRAQLLAAERENAQLTRELADLRAALRHRLPSSPSSVEPDDSSPAQSHRGSPRNSGASERYHSFGND